MRDLNMNEQTSGSLSNNVAWLGWMGVLGGFWLVIAPFILSYSSNDTSFYNDLITGGILAILTGYCAVMANNPKARAISVGSGSLTVLGGLWLIIAPFFLNYSDESNALWNDIFTGLLFLCISAYAVLTYSSDNSAKSNLI